MPLGVVNEQEFQRELENSSPKEVQEKEQPIITGEIIDLPTKGRNEGDVNVPQALRKVIGETYALDGRNEGRALARMFGVSDSSASAYAEGATSTASYNKPNTDILSFITQRKNRISKKALLKISKAIDHITEEKLQSVKARDLAGIAKDMSVIAKNMEPEVKGNSVGNNAQIILYAPVMQKEEHYTTIELNEG